MMVLSHHCEFVDDCLARKVITTLSAHAVTDDKDTHVALLFVERIDSVILFLSPPFMEQVVLCTSFILPPLASR